MGYLDLMGCWSSIRVRFKELIPWVIIVCATAIGVAFLGLLRVDQMRRCGADT